MHTVKAPLGHTRRCPSGVRPDCEIPARPGSSIELNLTNPVAGDRLGVLFDLQERIHRDPMSGSIFSLPAYPASEISCKQPRCEYSHHAETPAQHKQVCWPLVSNHLEDEQ